MRKHVRSGLLSGLKDERGYSLLMVLGFFLIGSIIIIPILTFANTALSSGQVQKMKSDEIYAADAGVENAQWQIRGDYLGSLFANPLYSPYDYLTPRTYQLPEPINGADTPLMTLRDCDVDASPLE